MSWAVISSRGRPGHSSGNGNVTNQSVGDRTGQLIDHWPDRQNNGFVPLSVLQLAIFNGIGQSQNCYQLGEIDVKEYQPEVHHEDVGPEEDEDNVGE